jgi:hypothetical protein
MSSGLILRFATPDDVPAIFELIKKSWELKSAEDKFIRPAQEYFESVENVSIDRHGLRKIK